MLTITTVVATEPITLSEAKAHARVEINDDDAYIMSLITVAREAIEKSTGVALAVASYSWTPEDLNTTDLPLVPATVTSAADVIPITFDTVPGIVSPTAKHAILMLIGDLYENRETQAERALYENRTIARLTSLIRENMGV